MAHNLRGGGGVSVGRNIIRSLLIVAPQHRYHVSIPGAVGYEGVVSGLPSKQVCMAVDHGSILNRVRYEMLVLTPSVRRFDPDIVLNLGGTALDSIRKPQVMLCHNPHLWYSARHFGKTIGTSERLRYFLLRSKFRRDLGRVEVLMCQTESAQARIRSMYAYSGKLHICPNAVSNFVLSSEQRVSVPAALSRLSGKKKLFYLTAYYSHKNLEVLPDLFLKYQKELKDYVVVTTFSERQHPGAERLLKQVRDMGLSESIINVGPLQQEELAGYFHNCHALLMPTLLESFSASYLEAMHFGLPILTSDLDFAREVCGDAALYFDPWNAASIMDAIQRLETEPHLKDKGRSRLAELFISWEEISESVSEMLEKIVSRHGSGNPYAQRSSSPCTRHSILQES